MARRYTKEKLESLLSDCYSQCVADWQADGEGDFGDYFGQLMEQLPSELYEEPPSNKKLDEIEALAFDTWYQIWYSRDLDNPDVPEGDAENGEMDITKCQAEAYWFRVRLQNINVREMEVDRLDYFPFKKFPPSSKRLDTLLKKDRARLLSIFVDLYINQIYANGYETPFKQWGFLSDFLQTDWGNSFEWKEIRKALKEKVEGATLDIFSLTHCKNPFVIDVGELDAVKKLETVKTVGRDKEYFVEEIIKNYDQKLGLNEQQKDNLRNALKSLKHELLIATSGFLLRQEGDDLDDTLIRGLSPLHPKVRYPNKTPSGSKISYKAYNTWYKSIWVMQKYLKKTFNKPDVASELFREEEELGRDHWQAGKGDYGDFGKWVGIDHQHARLRGDQGFRTLTRNLPEFDVAWRNLQREKLNYMNVTPILK